MYVRWVVRRHKNATIADTSFYDAYLVASYRDERGVPRQRTICYLGNIRQIADEFPMIERELFLLRAERILLSIEELGEVDREEALDALRQKVPPLTREEVMTAFVENLRWYRRWWEQNGGGPTDDELIKIVQLARGRLGPV
ncbi:MULTISPECIES: hypothetical protein [Candidatus Chloroploca]|uniref:Uncharacterized protein n=1 Tax=Candidatus Chloroploca asiatica TaxID=1506545 RepID=A0A2H3L0B8_9CHLR|nr:MULTISPECIES: hypothetical protein [Candidatus Chloroploca]PDV99755.1 hypothetical protein A9Q02_00630 [Candidatus Chloroploca asiatica]